MGLYLLLSLFSMLMWLMIDWQTAVVGVFLLLIPWLYGMYVVSIMSIKAPFHEKLALLIVGRSNPEVLAAYAIVQPRLDGKKKKKKKHA